MDNTSFMIWFKSLKMLVNCFPCPLQNRVQNYRNRLCVMKLLFKVIEVFIVSTMKLFLFGVLIIWFYENLQKSIIELAVDYLKTDFPRLSIVFSNAFWNKLHAFYKNLAHSNVLFSFQARQALLGIL